jgi:hypothetical protein
MKTLLPLDPSSETRKGVELFGDSMNGDEIRHWYEMEKEAFSGYLEKNTASERVHPFYVQSMRRVLAKVGMGRQDLKSILIMGPGEGNEVDQLARMHPTAQIILVEPSEELRVRLRGRFPRAEIVVPEYTGKLSLDDNSISLAVAMGVLHHIPNVSYVLSELYRVLESSGLLYLREPCSAMGIWGVKRGGLTPNERGIATTWMKKTTEELGFSELRKPRPMGLDPILKLASKSLTDAQLGSSALYHLDALSSKLLAFNNQYYRDGILKRVGPSSYEYLLKK